MLETNNFTAMDNKMIPKTFLNTDMMPGPNNFSNLPALRNTKYTIIMFKMMAMMMLISPNSARNAKTVVNEPAPAINGKAIGTMDADSGVESR